MALPCLLASSARPGGHGVMLTHLTRRLSPHHTRFSVNDFHSEPVSGSSAADKRPDRIVAAALAEFAENGYSGSRLAAVARRAGVSKPTLLRYFGSKDEIFREVVRTTLLGRMAMFDGGLAHHNNGNGPVTAAEQVRAFAHHYWAMAEQPGVAEVLRLAIGELPRFPELTMFYVTETLERSVRTLERIIQGGIARGELHPHDARASARTVLARVAAHALWFAHPEIYAGVTGADRDRAAASTIDSLVEALAPLAPVRHEPSA